MASRDDKRARRERAEQMRKERERQEKRRRNVITAAVVAVVLVVIAGAGFAVKAAVDNSADDPARTPEGLTEDGGIALTATDVGGTAAADPVKVTLFEDFACPHCKAFEEEAGSWIDEQVAAGAIDVEFRPVAFLTDFSGDAMGSALCVFEDAGAKAYRDYSELVFANQPTEGGNLDEKDFVDMAEQAGATGAADCIKGRPFRDFADLNGEATKAAFDQEDSEGNKLSGTPTVWVNGTTLNGPEDADGNPTVPGLADLQKAVEAAKAG
ncbi:DsbA family protein [Mumia sp. DW29H23]|uniref:DsbA family protein n=1 Tax=Mumia sp. DW29H23 TaxID=3421241 RepID=UPI003D68A16E